MKRRPIRRSAWPPSPRQRLRIVAATAVICLPYTLYLPLWLTLLAGILFAWQLYAAWHDTPRPGFVLRMTMLLGLVAIVFAGWGRLSGLGAGSALLILMLGLKLSEVRHHHDAMLVLLLGYFVLISQCLWSQSLFMIVWLTFGCWLLTTLLIDLNSGPDGGTTVALCKTSARLLLQALPVAAVLFVLFPRIPGPLWGLPDGAGASAVTGLSDHMSPGSITRLVRSNAVVLRAQFNGSVPPPDERYWRGPVLWQFDNGTWSVGQRPRHWPAPRVITRPQAVKRVRITLEPNSSDWLIALDVPIASATAARFTAGATLVAQHAINAPRTYNVRSMTRGILQPRLPAAMRTYASALPAHGNPRARALASRWQQRLNSPRAIIAKALTMFHQQPFVYTLTPAPLGDANRIDQFLFQTREGFCAHYAGAFTFLMRAAGLPARVVTGYLGGQPGTLGDYWIVRSADAHAWSEVWINGAGWVRVDPTAAIAPQRIQAGLAAALADDSVLPFMLRGAGSAWYQVRMVWDGINTAWNRWFLAYGPSLQTHLLGSFGLGNWRRMLLALTVLVVTLLALISAWLAWQTRRPASHDAIQRAWLRVCRRLARHGYARASHEGPQAYARRVTSQRPDWAAALQQLADDYIALRYAGHGTAATRRRFLRAAARFRPRRRRR